MCLSGLDDLRARLPSTRALGQKAGAQAGVLEAQLNGVKQERGIADATCQLAAKKPIPLSSPDFESWDHPA